MTFRIRTALVVLALTAITMGAAFGGVWEHFVASQRHQLDEALLAVARDEAADAAMGHLEFTDAPGPSANAVGPLPKFGVLYSLGGRPISMTPNFTTENVPSMPRLAPMATGFDLDHEGHPLRAVMVSVPNTTMRVLLAAPREDFEEDARILARAMTIAFFVGCIWAAVVAYAVATRLTREHRSVGEVARRVASGDTSARVAFRSSDADLRQLADDLNAMIERLVGLLAIQERFVSHAAHELRTPLTSLRIELEHALRTARGRDDYEPAVRGALDSTRRLTNLAEDLLQLARLRSVQREDEANIEDAVADAVADVSPVSRTRDIFIYAEPCSAKVRGDRRGLARVIRNVLENAVRFAPRGTRVRVETTVEADEVLLRVTDEGPGVEADDTERIFEPFARATRSDGAEGTGLGLAIARGLARSFDGDVEAAPGPGGRFLIRVARRKAAAAGVVQATGELDGVRPLA